MQELSLNREERAETAKKLLSSNGGRKVVSRNRVTWNSGSLQLEMLEGESCTCRQWRKTRELLECSVLVVEMRSVVTWVAANIIQTKQRKENKIIKQKKN